jgi:hypothetical protein
MIAFIHLERVTLFFRPSNWWSNLNIITMWNLNFQTHFHINAMSEQIVDLIQEG